MPSLHYAAVDPGFKGAIAVINASGTSLKVWDVPITQKGTDRTREYDLHALRSIFCTLTQLPSLTMGIEFPTTRPDEGAERSERFGRGKGYLEAFAFLHNIEYQKLVPNLWKGRLGLEGKVKDPTSEAGVRLFEEVYPQHSDIIRGPRGGLLDGRLDALLMCHFLRTREPQAGLRSMDRGKYTPEMMGLIFARSKRVKRKMIGPQ